MTLDLKQAIEKALEKKMSPEELKEQRLSFIYGQRSTRDTRTKEEYRKILTEMGMM